MGALSHLRIVEIGSAAAASYCSRLFADFGATVQKVEPPQGDPLRRTAPLTPKGQSAWFAFLNFNKSSLVIDPDDAGAPARLTELIGNCDVLIDGRDVDAADCPAFDLAALRTKNPGLIHLDVSWFGREGPYAKFEATDSTIRALTGLIKLVGPAEGPPMHAPDFQTGILAGLWGFYRAASSVLGRMQDGHGRASSLSIFESSIAATEYTMFESFVHGDIMRRIGVNRFWPTFPVGIYETRQGWLGVTTVTPAQWRAFCEMLGLHELRDDATLFDGRRPAAAHGRNRKQVHSEAEAAHRAGVVRGRVEAKNPDRAGAWHRRPDRRCREAIARRHRPDHDRRTRRDLPRVPCSG